MRAVIQRVNRASVRAGSNEISKIEKGILALVAVEKGDKEKDAEYISRKIADLRVFEDTTGKMNCSVRDIGGSILLVPQFTLAADTSRGLRPSFSDAMEPKSAKRLIDYMLEFISRFNLKVESGVFGEYMLVDLENDGPVTFFLDSRKRI